MRLSCRQCAFTCDLVSEATTHVIENDGHVVQGKGNAEDTTITIEVGQ